jgi:DNA repair exonuclease SbcCD ATPase subunit
LSYPNYLTAVKTFSATVDEINGFEIDHAQFRKSLVQKIKTGEADAREIKELSDMAEDRLACIRAMDNILKKLESLNATLAKWQQQAEKDRELVLKGMSTGEAAAKKLARQTREAEMQMKEVIQILLTAVGQMNGMLKQLKADDEANGRYFKPFNHAGQQLNELAHKLSRYFQGGTSSILSELLQSLT